MTLSRTLYIECHYAECRDLCIVMLNVIMLSVVMLNVIMLNVVMLSVVMLNVVAPSSLLQTEGNLSLSVCPRQVLQASLIFVSRREHAQVEHLTGLNFWALGVNHKYYRSLKHAIKNPLA